MDGNCAFEIVISTGGACFNSMSRPLVHFGRMKKKVFVVIVSAIQAVGGETGTGGGEGGLAYCSVG